MSAAEVCYYTGVSMAVLRGLEKAGIVAFSEEEALRLPDFSQVEPSGPIVLNAEQEAAFQSILALTRTGRPEAVLLQGCLLYTSREEECPVEHYLIIARSVTYAQRMQRVLGRAGIRSRIFRAPRDLTDRGCAYACLLYTSRCV